MATYNGILRFAEQDDGTNILQQGDYAADPQRTFGHQPGAARRILENKVLRQTSLASAGVAQFIADHQSEDVTDDMSTQQFADALGNAIAASSSPGSAESVQITSGVKLFIEDSGGTIGTSPADTAAALEDAVAAIAGDGEAAQRAAVVADGVTGYINGQGIPTPDPATPQLITSALTNAISNNISNNITGDGGYQFSNATAQGVYVFCGNNGVQPPWPGEQGYGAAAIGQAIGAAVINQVSGLTTPITITSEDSPNYSHTGGELAVNTTAIRCVLLGTDTYKMRLKVVEVACTALVGMSQGRILSSTLQLALTSKSVGTKIVSCICVPFDEITLQNTATAQASFAEYSSYEQVIVRATTTKYIQANTQLKYRIILLHI